MDGAAGLRGDGHIASAPSRRAGWWRLASRPPASPCHPSPLRTVPCRAALPARRRRAPSDLFLSCAPSPPSSASRLPCTRHRSRTAVCRVRRRRRRRVLASLFACLPARLSRARSARTRSPLSRVVRQTFDRDGLAPRSSRACLDGAGAVSADGSGERCGVVWRGDGLGGALRETS